MINEVEILDIIEKLGSESKDSELKPEHKAGISKLNTLLTELAPSLQEQGPKLFEYQSLQDKFEYNITSSLLNIYRLIYNKSNSDYLKSSNHESSNMVDTSDEDMILTLNKLLQGLLLLHPKSRRLFTRKDNMNLILGFLKNPQYSTTILKSFISNLVHILLKNLDNFRTFENCNGCSIIIEKLNLQILQKPLSPKKDISSEQQLTFKIIEFLLFYFVDENEVTFEYSTTKNANKLSIKEKANFFRNEFPGIDALIANLNDLKTL